MVGIPEDPLQGEAETSEVSSKAWLLSGISSLPGLLQLDDGQLTFTSFGTGSLWPFQLRALERAASKPGFAHKIDSGERSELFSAPFAEVSDVLFPWYYFGCGMKLVVRGIRYRFSFVQPQNSPELPEMGVSLADGRNVGRRWKSALVLGPIRKGQSPPPRNGDTGNSFGESRLRNS